MDTPVSSDLHGTSAPIIATARFGYVTASMLSMRPCCAGLRRHAHQGRHDGRGAEISGNPEIMRATNVIAWAMGGLADGFGRPVAAG